MMCDDLMTLYMEQKNLASMMANLKERIKANEEAIFNMMSDRLRQMYDLSGKQSGAMNIATDYGIKVRAEIAKKVEWNSDTLMSAAKRLPWEDVQKIFDIKISIPEKAYGKLQEAGIPDDVLAAINQARTVKYGDMKITLEEEK